MRNRFLALVCAACLGWGGPSAAETLHAAHPLAEPPFERDAACGDGPAEGLVGYDGAERVCADVLTQRLREDPRLVGGAVSEVVLLTSRPMQRTLYRAGDDRRAVLPIANLARRAADPLTIRGPRDAAGRPLVWFKGLDLVDTLCDPARVLDAADCRAGRPVGKDDGTAEPWETRYELTSLVLIEETEIQRALSDPAATASPITDRGPHAYCVRLRHVAGIVLSGLGFEDCWLAAILAVNAHDVALEDSEIHGSTFGFLALATGGMEADVHGFRILRNHWVQSPAAYRPDPKPCAHPETDLSCAVDPWDDLPWGVIHHHIWRPLNGALFGSYNVAGNVLFEGNLVERAFNGIRMISEHPGTGRNVEVRGNRFRMLRDNAVEPEDRADGWVVAQNTFENVHGWISTDGVAGGTMYVFGNRGWDDPGVVAGDRCREDVDWSQSPRFTGLAGKAGRYVLLDTGYDPSTVECTGHFRGVVLKTGDDAKAGFPYFRDIAIFNNTWRTRSPLFSSKHASPLVHFNNLIAFTGCGLDGPWECRQIPAPPEYCQPGNKRTRGRIGLSTIWTGDGMAMVTDCFTLTPGPAEPDERAAETRDAAHLFCRDAYDRPFDSAFYGAGDCAPVFRAGLLATSRGGDLAPAGPVAGCAPQVAGDTVRPDCARPGPVVGAIQPDGALFDIAIPGAGYLGADFRN